MLTSDYLDAASSFRRTVILALSFAFFCTVIKATSGWKLTLEANPDQPLIRENNTGDSVTLTCKGFIPPTTTSFSFSVLHTLDEEVTTYVFKAFPTGEMPTASVSTQPVGCYAASYMCEGISSTFSYSGNGSLVIVVVIRSFLCRLRGLWTCGVILRYGSDLENIHTKAKLIFHGFSSPSNLTLTLGDAPRKEMNQVAVMAGSKVLLTCRGNVGSTDARFIFVSYRYNSSERDAEWFNASKESDYKQTKCHWIHEATFDLDVVDTDDLKIFICKVRDNHHNTILSSSPTTLYVVNGPGTTWSSVSKSNAKSEFISDQVTTMEESMTAVSDSNCFENVWIVFGVVTISVIVIVLIMESANSVYKKVKTAWEED